MSTQAPCWEQICSRWEQPRTGLLLPCSVPMQQPGGAQVFSGVLAWGLAETMGPVPKHMLGGVLMCTGLEDNYCCRTHPVLCTCGQAPQEALPHTAGGWLGAVLLLRQLPASPQQGEDLPAGSCPVRSWKLNSTEIGSCRKLPHPSAAWLPAPQGSQELNNARTEVGEGRGSSSPVALWCWD